MVTNKQTNNINITHPGMTIDQKRSTILVNQSYTSHYASSSWCGAVGVAPCCCLWRFSSSSSTTKVELLLLVLLLSSAAATAPPPPTTTTTTTTSLAIYRWRHHYPQPTPPDAIGYSDAIGSETNHYQWHTPTTLLEKEKMKESNT